MHKNELFYFNKWMNNSAKFKADVLIKFNKSKKYEN